MSTYSLMNLLLLFSTAFFAASTLLLLWEKVKQKKLIIKALENNQKIFESQFITDENQLKEVMGDELSEKLTDKIAEVISIEKESNKNLCTLFIDHHPEAIELLPFAINQIIAAYLNCINEILILLKAKNSEELQQKEDDLVQYGSLIEQLRSEKHTYSEKYNDALNLLNLIYLKYKDPLEDPDMPTLEGMSLKEIAITFKILSFKENS